MSIVQQPGGRTTQDVNIVGGLNGSSSSNASTPSVNTIDTTAEIVLAANAVRKKFFLQNVGTTRIFIAFGATPTSSNYHIALPACGSQGDGSSPVYADIMWIGRIEAISSGNGGLLQVTEFLE